MQQSALALLKAIPVGHVLLLVEPLRADVGGPAANVLLCYKL